MSSLPSLKKKTVEGKLYKRGAKTEALIRTCLELTFDELCNQAEISARSHANYIPSEVLVYFLRQTKTHNNDDQFYRLYQLLEKRIKRACLYYSGVRLSDNDDPDVHILDFQEFVLDDFAERVMLDRQRYEEKLDTFECKFDKAVALRKTDAMRKMYRRDKPKEQIEYDEDGDITADVERALAELHPDVSSIEDDMTYRFQLQRAINSLPEDERRVINMIFAGIPSESTNLDTPTISKLLGCGPQTVRNRRNRAVKKLKKMLGTEVKDVN